MSDQTLQSALCTVVAGLVAAWWLWALCALLARSRPGLAVHTAIQAGFAVRLAAVGLVAATGLETSLRGGDETTFLQNASGLARLPLTDGQWLEDLTHRFHTVVFALQLRVFDAPPTALRVTQVALAMTGVVLIVAAVHDLAGDRAARLAAWVLAVEPAGVFFDSALHKEPVMMLASGLVVLGGARVWRSLDAGGIVLLALGGAIAVATRSYAGWFLVSAGVLLVLHASLRRMESPLRALPLAYGVVVIAFLATPAIVQVTSSRSLERLQASQDANAAGTGQVLDANGDPVAGGGANGDNLALERVDFSSREKVVTNLPQRVVDVVLKPYPWQVDNASQQLGAAGSLVALAALVLLVRYAWGARGHVLRRTAPLLYPLGFLLVAYGLSAGNAGTGFRYRTHLVTLGLATLVVLRAHVRGTAVVPAVQPTPPPARGLVLGSPA